MCVNIVSYRDDAQETAIIRNNDDDHDHDGKMGAGILVQRGFQRSSGRVAVDSSCVFITGGHSQY